MDIKDRKDNILVIPICPFKLEKYLLKNFNININLLELENKNKFIEETIPDNYILKKIKKGKRKDNYIIKKKTKLPQKDNYKNNGRKKVDKEVQTDFGILCTQQEVDEMLEINNEDDVGIEYLNELNGNQEGYSDFQNEEIKNEINIKNDDCKCFELKNNLDENKKVIENLNVEIKRQLENFDNIKSKFKDCLISKNNLENAIKKYQLVDEIILNLFLFINKYDNSKLVIKNDKQFMTVLNDAYIYIKNNDLIDLNESDIESD